MQSKNIGYLPRLDHLRLLAALLVFAFHFFHHYLGGWQPRPEQPWLAPIVEGHTGVSLFFVLSGFIFMTIALRGDGAIDYRGFLRNRVLRIFPLFIVVFVVAISVGRDRFQPTDVLYLLFTNLGLAPTSWHFITGPAWSISVEFAFYLVFPFLARFTRERGTGYLLDLLLLVVIKLAAYAASEKSTHMLYSTLVGRFDQFVWGMLAAIAWRRHGERLSRLGGWPLLLSALAVFTALALQGRYASFFLPDPKQAAWIWWSGIEGLLWAAFVTSYMCVAWRLPARLDRWLAVGGEWSFSIYMWHTLVIFTVHHYLGFLRPSGRASIDLALNAAPVLALTLAFAWLSYQVIERPFLQLRGAYLRPGDGGGAGRPA